MAEKRILKGNEYVSLITGEHKIVSSVKDGTVKFSDGTEAPVPKIGTCFNYIGNNFPMETVDEADIAILDGELFINGARVETGSFKVRDLVISYPGAILLTVASRKDDKLQDLIRYCPRTDKFEKLLNGLSSIEVLHNDEENNVFAYKVTYCSSHEMENEDGTKYQVPDVAESLYICHGNDVVLHVDADEVEWCFGNMFRCFKEGSKTILVTTSNEALKHMEDANGYGFFTPEEAEKTGIFEFIYDCVQVGTHVDEETVVSDIEVTSSWYFNLEKDVSDIDLVHDGRQSLFIIMKNGICYTNANYHPRYAMGDTVSDTAVDYKHLLKVDCGTRYNTFYLSDDDMECVKIVVEKTADRGYVTTISKIKD